MDSVFEYDEDTEYPLPEFFTKFKDKLPQLVVVTGGDYGMTKWDDLSNDTVSTRDVHQQVPLSMNKGITKQNL